MEVGLLFSNILLTRGPSSLRPSSPTRPLRPWSSTATHSCLRIVRPEKLSGESKKFSSILTTFLRCTMMYYNYASVDAWCIRTRRAGKLLRARFGCIEADVCIQRLVGKLLRRSALHNLVYCQIQIF